MKPKPRVIVIVGPTASGKTSLSINIAKRFNGEIVSADSRQVYKGLNLGTGKVTKKEMDGIPHHLLDVADPMETYNVADFVRDGRKAISDILDRKKLPVVAGGTFFYTDALLGRFETPNVPPNPELRKKLETMSTDTLYAALLEMDERRAADIDSGNKRRLIRALEIVEAVGTVPSLRSNELYDSFTIGIDIPKDELHENIHTRLQERIDEGMIAETEGLHRNGLSYERMEELGLEYRYIARYLMGSLTKEKMLEELETKIRQFAKRQLTWLKRDKSIRWFSLEEKEKIFDTIENFTN